MPNRPSPAPTSEKILASLAAMANEIDPNGFELKRLEREARKLLNVDAVSGYTALGAVASLRGDVEDVHAHHKRALNLSGESAEALHNYAASLTKLGEFTEALEVARRAYARAPADPAVLDGVVSSIHLHRPLSRILRAGQQMERVQPRTALLAQLACRGDLERRAPRDLHRSTPFRKSWPSPTRPSDPRRYERAVRKSTPTNTNRIPSSSSVSWLHCPRRPKISMKSWTHTSATAHI